MLKVGLLWFDDDLKRPLVAKLDEAVERYEERFGARPTSVQMHPTQAEGLLYGRLKVLGDAHLRRNHFLLGMEEGETAPLLDAPEAAAVEEGLAPRRRRASRGRKGEPTLGDLRRQGASRRAS
jgi:hypothetical protein